MQDQVFNKFSKAYKLLFFGKLQFFPKAIYADKNPFLMSEFLTLTAQANAVFMSQFTSLIF